MKTALRFADVVEAADKLSEEEQKTLVDILYQRQVARNRERIRREALEAEEDLRAGRVKPMTVDEIMRETEP